ncbi:MAG: phosphoadenylyl-sulfate reductase [Gammaproteobacteria bacterium]|jgi:phosphoadenosine phosphosulfate reductase|nr:phosphoadenylyl-sulfate reductase [Gammaproteobacteria bacterium]
MTAVTFDVDKLAAEYINKTPSEILALAIEHFDNISISFSGAEDVVLIDMAIKIKPDIKVFSLDTGRLHPETYKFMEQVREHYNINIDLMSPDHKQLEKFVREKGLYSFYQDGHQECCGIRKVMPLRRALSTLDAWITGQRQDQSPDTRYGVPVIQKDNAFSSEDKILIKFNPLSLWTSKQVWQYIRDNDVPYNELHSKGFQSIGCEPCTRAILPNQHEREGRWWWEDATKKECGLHLDNIKK